MAGDGVGTEMAKQENPEANLEIKRYSKWVIPIQRQAKLMPEAILIGGAAFTLQIATKKPELLDRFMSSDGPHDLDIICTPPEFDMLRENFPFMESKGGYHRQPSKMPESFFTSLFDEGSNLRLDIIKQGTGPVIGSEVVVLNGEQIRIQTLEEMALYRLFQFTGYEKQPGQGFEQDLNLPKPHHFEMYRIIRQMIDNNKMDRLFPIFKERMKIERGIIMLESDWHELEQKLSLN